MFLKGKNYLIFAVSALLLSGCVAHDKKIFIQALNKPELILPNPEPFALDSVKLYPLSKAAKAGDVGSIDQFWKEVDKELATSGLAITPSGFKKYIKNQTKIRLYIREQQAIIAAYRKYYANKTVH